MDENKIREVFSDEEFVQSLLTLETPQEVQAAVGAKGIELSIADIEGIRARILSGNGELSAEELDNVAGGVFITSTAIMIGVLLLGVGCGALFGVAGGVGITVTSMLTNGRW